MRHFLRVTLLVHSFEWLDLLLQMDLHLFISLWKIKLKELFCFFSIINSSGGLDMVSLTHFVQSQSMSPFTLPKWLLRMRHFILWELKVLAVWHVQLLLAMSKNLRLIKPESPSRSTGKEYLDSGSAQRVFQVLPSTLVQDFSAMKKQSTPESWL